ncbi:GntR family transcriptional regulator [Paenibacillus flagellatus]|uniref:GntR family transcriptional regulator n=1 Tax=Paenibacillus flagellatus TaxID=2211139 RepID=UPI00130520B1|nr:GntR family transcriptional regulator [Paenibacillus flagellatus]
MRYIQVKRMLLEHIASLKPHDRLPSRTVLSETYQAARTTIERAVSELIGEGVLYARDGSGTYVSDAAGLNQGSGAAGRTWGLLIPDILHYIYPGILRGVSDVASEGDVNLIVCHTDNDYPKQTRHLRKLIDTGVDGIVVVPAITGTVDMSPFYELQAAGVPFVFCHRMLEGIQAPRVISNNFYAGYIAAKHLLANGCERIGYISRPVYSASSERYQGFVCALAEANVPVRGEWVAFEPTFEPAGEGYESALRMLRGAEKPDGLFCFNDGIAKGACDAAREAGLSVGKDIRVVGCDNTNICDTMPVPLTSVKFPTYEMGAQAARLLLDGALDGSRTVVLQPELIVRGSSAAT